MTARCVLWAHKLRLVPPPPYPYSPSAQRTVLLCEAYRRYRSDIETERTEYGARGKTKATEGTRSDQGLGVSEGASCNPRALRPGRHVLSLSAYLLAVGMNTPIRSVVDLAAVADLAKVNGDFGRVAGLLKFWLAERRGQGR